MWAWRSASNIQAKQDKPGRITRSGFYTDMHVTIASTYRVCKASVLRTILSDPSRSLISVTYSLAKPVRRFVVALVAWPLALTAL